MATIFYNVNLIQKSFKALKSLQKDRRNSCFQLTFEEALKSPSSYNFNVDAIEETL